MDSPSLYNAFDEAGLTDVTQSTREKFVKRIHELYEQGANSTRIREYVRRWLFWVRSGLSEIAIFACHEIGFAFSCKPDLRRPNLRIEMH